MKVIFCLAVVIIVLLVIGGLFLDGTDFLSSVITPMLDSACNMNSNCTW